MIICNINTSWRTHSCYLWPLDVYRVLLNTRSVLCLKKQTFRWFRRLNVKVEVQYIRYAISRTYVNTYISHKCDSEYYQPRGNRSSPGNCHKDFMWILDRYTSFDSFFPFFLFFSIFLSFFIYFCLPECVLVCVHNDYHSTQSLHYMPCLYAPSSLAMCGM